MTTTHPNLGSVLHVAPADGHVAFHSRDGQESLPKVRLIGWAVVVTGLSGAGAIGYSTVVEPLVLFESKPVPLSHHLRDSRGPGTTTSVRLSTA